jgi:hypothetical protein
MTVFFRPTDPKGKEIAEKHKDFIFWCEFCDAPSMRVEILDTYHDYYTAHGPIYRKVKTHTTIIVTCHGKMQTLTDPRDVKRCMNQILKPLRSEA